MSDTRARGLALAGAGAHGADGDHRLGGLDLGVARAHQAEIGAQGVHQRGLVHHVLVRHVGIGEDDLFGLVRANQVGQFLFGADRNSLGIEAARQFGGEDATLDIRDLRGGEGHHLVVLVAAKEGVEVVEVASSGPHDDRLDRHLLFSLFPVTSATGCCRRLVPPDRYRNSIDTSYITSGAWMSRRRRAFTNV